MSKKKSSSFLSENDTALNYDAQESSSSSGKRKPSYTNTGVQSFSRASSSTNEYHLFNDKQPLLSSSGSRKLSDSVLDKEYQSISADGKPAKRCCWGRLTRLQCGLLITFNTLLFLGIGFIVLYFAILPGVVQSTVDGSSVGILRMSMTSPTNTSFVLSSDLLLTNAGSFDAKLHPASINMVYNGTTFGIVPGTQVDIVGDHDVVFQISNPVTVVDTDAFNNFSIALTNTEFVQLNLHAIVTLTVYLGPIGIDFSGIRFDKEMQLAGLRGLKNLSLDVFQMLVDPVTNDAVTQVVIGIDNPSNVSVLPLGDVRFQMLFQDVVMGELVATNLSVVPGLNPTLMQGAVKPVNNTVANTLFTQYLAGKPSQLRAIPVKPFATNVALYNTFLETLDLSVVLNGMTIYLLNNGIMSIGLDLFGQKIPTQLNMTNPFVAPITIVAFDQKVIYNGEEVAYYTEDVRSNPIHLASNTSTLTRALPIHFYDRNAIQGAESLFAALFDGFVMLGVSGSMTVQIGNQENVIQYTQPPVQICREGKKDLCGF